MGEARGRERHVEIAGGGLSGLTAAAAFARAGWSVRVHERGDHLREIGAGIFMWENGLRVLEAIDAYDQAVAGGEQDEYWEIRDERDRLLQSGWMMRGARLYTILRTSLHQALADAARRAGAEIVTGSWVVGATPDGEVQLGDGTRHRADLIVGADGIGSRVRDANGLATAVVDLRDGCGRYLIDRRPDDVRNKSLEYWNGGRRVGVVPASPDKVYLYLCCPEDDVAGRRSPSDPGFHDDWIATFPGLRGYIERVTDNGRWASFGDVSTRSWSAGRVAIVGDAAHAMAPNLGQGACVAMQTALALAQHIADAADVPAALARWEAQQRPVAEATQRFSRLYGRIGTRWPRPLLDARSALVWGIGRSSALQRRINVAAHADVTRAAAAA